MSRADWNYPTRVWFGPGRLQELGAACRELGMQRPLLVTDPGVAALPFLSAAVERNRTAGLPTEVFSAIAANPTGAHVDAGVAVYRRGGHDGVIALGGGSGIDVGKTVALMVGQSRPLWDFEDVGDNWTRVDPDGMAPLVAVPTTAGTGSEVGRATAIIDEASREKKIIFHPRMLPAIAICDPELLVGLPPAITAATGLDALAHCLEAYCAKGFHPLADGIAVEGMRLLVRSLVRAFQDGSDLAARSDTLAAASMGATAFQKGLGAVHALSHPIGARHGIHHGLTNAVLMPYVLAFNAPVLEGRLDHLSRALALPRAGFPGVLSWLLDLRTRLQIPHTLADLAIPEADLDSIATSAARDPSAPGNPRPLDVPALKSILDASWAGRL